MSAKQEDAGRAPPGRLGHALATLFGSRFDTAQ
jgi:hypothetical protein